MALTAGSASWSARTDLACAVCKVECQSVEHARVIGDLSHPERCRTIRFTRALYFSEATDVDFCGAACSLAWHEALRCPAS